MAAFWIVLSYVGIFAVGTIVGFAVAAIVTANDTSRGHPL